MKMTPIALPLNSRMEEKVHCETYKLFSGIELDIHKLIYMRNDKQYPCRIAEYPHLD